jgi:hypothetical protein
VACLFAYFAEHGNARLSFLYSRPFVLLSSKIPLALRLGNERHFRLFCRVMVFLTLWIPASLRYGIGYDYYSYVNIFNNINLWNGEIGWVLLNKVIHFLGLSSQWVFAFSSFLIYFPICFIIKRKNFFYCIIFFFILLIYRSSYDIIRQHIAVSFLVAAVIALGFKKNIRFFIWVALASLFHQTALFMLFFFPLKYLRFKKNIIPIIITIFGVFILFRFDFLKITYFIANLVDSKYALYEFSEYGTRVRELGTGLGLLTKMLPSLLIIFMLPKITKRYPQMAFVANLAIISVFANILAAQFKVMVRFNCIFNLVPLLATGFAIGVVSKYKKIIGIAVAIAVIGSNLLIYEKHMGQYYSIFSNVTEEEVRGDR